MSTIRAKNIAHPSATEDQIVLNADGSFGGELATQLGSKLDLAGKRIIQVVTYSDTVRYTTSSTSPQDAYSISITPQLSTSTILLATSSTMQTIGGALTNITGFVQITDSSNATLSGNGRFGATRSSGFPSGSNQYFQQGVLFATNAPGVTSAVTYKTRFLASDASATAQLDGQTRNNFMLAIEVSA